MFKNINLKRLFVITCLVLFLCLFVGCSSKDRASIEPSLAEYDGDANYDIGETKDTIEDSLIDGRKIYFNIYYSVNSESIKDDINKLNNIRITYEGFIESSNFVSYTTYARAEYVLRIPTDNLDNFMNDFESGSNFNTKNIKSNDITKKYDTNKALVDAYTASLNQYQSQLEKGGLSVNEVNNITKEISILNTKLAEFQNIQNEYDNLLEYSTVKVVFEENSNVENEEGFFTEYGRYILGFLRVIGTIILYLVPFAFIAGVVLCSIFIPKKIRRNRKLKNNNN